LKNYGKLEYKYNLKKSLIIIQIILNNISFIYNRTTYNLTGGSWVLDIYKIIDIFNNSININTNYFYTDDSLALILSVFDTNCEGVIDAFEFFIALALISGMDLIDKLQFIFSVYDFNSSGLLHREGLTLLIKSSISGIMKTLPSNGMYLSIRLFIKLYFYIIFNFFL
jgi:hypothetical protein